MAANAQQVSPAPWFFTGLTKLQVPPLDDKVVPIEAVGRRRSGQKERCQDRPGRQKKHRDATCWDVHYCRASDIASWTLSGSDFRPESAMAIRRVSWAAPHLAERTPRRQVKHPYPVS